jgi:hypothetical protein
LGGTAILILPQRNPVVRRRPSRRSIIWRREAAHNVAGTIVSSQWLVLSAASTSPRRRRLSDG